MGKIINVAQTVNSKKDKYSFTKLGVETASVLIGLTFTGIVHKPSVVKADALNDNAEKTQKTADKTKTTPKNINVGAVEDNTVNQNSTTQTSKQSFTPTDAVNKTSNFVPAEKDNTVTSYKAVKVKSADMQEKNNNQSQTSQNNQPVVTNQVATNVSKSTIPNTQVGNVKFYSYESYFDGVSASGVKDDGTYLSVPYTKETDNKYNIVNLSDYTSKLLDTISPAYNAVTAKPQNINYIDINGQVIKDVDPNKLTNITQDTAVFIQPCDFTGTVSDQWPSIDQSMREAQNVLDKAPFDINDNQDAIYNVTYPNSLLNNNDGFDLGQQNYWSIYNPVQIIRSLNKNGVNGINNSVARADNVADDKLTSEDLANVYTLGSINGTDDSGNARKMYIGFDSNSTSNSVELAQNIEKLTQSLKQYDGKALSKNDTEKLISTLQKQGLTLYDTPDEAVQAILQDNPQNTMANSSSIFGQLIPEYDSQGNVVKGKYAGKVFFIPNTEALSESDYLTNSNGKSITTTILYQGLDPDYTGIIKPFYMYTGVGSGGSSVGFLTIPVENKISNITATIKFIDDTQGEAHQDLSSYNQTATGKRNTTITFSNNVEDQIKELLAKGFKLVSDNFDNSTKLYQSDATKNQFEVHFVHNTKPVTTSNTITRTIHYEGASEYTPDDVEQPLTFIATGTQDLVTKKTSFDWSPAQSFNAVKSPIIQGYHVVDVNKDTTDNINVAAKSVDHTGNNYTVTVTYAPDAPKDVTLTVKYYDDTQGKSNKDLSSYDKKITQAPGTSLTYTTQSTISKLESQGFKLISDSYTAANLGGKMPSQGGNYEVHLIQTAKPTDDTQQAQVFYLDINDSDNPVQLSESPILTGQPGDKVNYSTKDSITNYEAEGYKLVEDGFQNAVFDNDNTSEQKYYVTFNHTLEPKTVTKNVTETVHYTGAGDETPKDNVQNSQWTQVSMIDKVTGKVVSTGAWAITKGQKIIYDQVNSPEISGYTPDEQNVPATEVTQDNIVVTVTYAPNKPLTPTSNEEKATVIYINVNNGKILATSGTLAGKTGESINKLYSTKDELQILENKGYELVYNSFDGDGITKKFDNNNSNIQQFIVGLKPRDITPSQPTSPDNPTTPNNLTTPANPTSPETPTAPSNPTTPANPTSLDNSTTPNNPTIPENPINSTTSNLHIDQSIIPPVQSEITSITGNTEIEPTKSSSSENSPVKIASLNNHPTIANKAIDRRQATIIRRLKNVGESHSEALPQTGTNSSVTSEVLGALAFGIGGLVGLTDILRKKRKN